MGFNRFVLLIVLILFGSRLATADTSIPAALEAPQGNKVQLTLHAKGEQIYLCILDAGAYLWKWQAPDAKLYDSQNQALVGVHGVGPSWIHNDGSKVTARALQKVDAPEKTSAPWLLLEAISHKGNGIFAKTSYIQRINTQGGTAPGSVCDSNHLGTEKRIPYVADYVFFRK